MSEDSEKVLRMALKGVLGAARDLHLDLDELTEAAIRLMVREKRYDSNDVTEAAVAIEMAVDTLPPW
uniref:ANTAR domain-containing protein n=1 Tax=Pseudomonas graminis TaxID=158627 RepID=A0A7C1WRE9_9PSED